MSFALDNTSPPFLSIFLFSCIVGSVFLILGLPLTDGNVFRSIRFCLRKYRVKQESPFPNKSKTLTNDIDKSVVNDKCLPFFFFFV